MLTWAVVGVFVIIFAGSIIWFRNAKKHDVGSKTGVPAISVLNNQTIPSETTATFPDATLIGLSSNKPIGTATRGLQDGVYHVSMNATLPGVDATKQFYKAWLVRQVPYDFIPAGNFALNALGTFALEWNGVAGKSYQDYSQVVITLQAIGGEEDPQAHIAEGYFGK